jgi:hypothetical protein
VTKQKDENYLNKEDCFFLVFVGAWLSTTEFISGNNPLILVLTIITTLSYCLILGGIRENRLWDTIKAFHVEIIVFFFSIIVFCLSNSVSNVDIAFIVTTFFTWFVTTLLRRGNSFNSGNENENEKDGS